MGNRLHIILFALVIIISIFLRFYNLEKNPNGFYLDEAVTGYNAYSIAETGRDEYGKSYPLAFRFFGTYTPPIYTYLTAFIIKFLEPSIFSTRFISALSGVALTILVYFFIKNLNATRNKTTPLIGAFIFSITPWSILYSRVGYEVNLAFLIFSLGLFFSWLGIKKPIFLIIGFSFLAISASVYHTERLLSLLSAIGFCVLFYKEFIRRKTLKYLILSLVFFAIFLTPQILLLFTPAGWIRGQEVFYSKNANPINIAFEFSSQYLSYFSPKNLFFETDPDPQRSIPELSVFYSPWVIFYVVGIFSLTKIKDKRTFRFLLLVLLISPIPAALTKDPFATQRALPLLLPLTFILSLGAEKVMTSNKKYLGVVVILILLLLPLVSLYRSYAVLLPNERAKTWGYGYEQLALEIKKRNKDEFLIENSRNKPAYTELVFFLKYPPEKLQQNVDPRIRENYYGYTNWDGNYKMDNVEVRAIIWEKDLCKDQIIVGDSLLFSENHIKNYQLKKEFEIKSPIDEIIFMGFRTDPKVSCVPAKI